MDLEQMSNINSRLRYIEDNFDKLIYYRMNITQQGARFFANNTIELSYDLLEELIKNIDNQIK